MAAAQFLHDHRDDGPAALQPNTRLKLAAPVLNSLDAAFADDVVEFRLRDFQFGAAA